MKLLYALQRFKLYYIGAGLFFLGSYLLSFRYPFPFFLPTPGFLF